MVVVLGAIACGCADPAITFGGGVRCDCVWVWCGCGCADLTIPFGGAIRCDCVWVWVYDPTIAFGVVVW